MFINQLQISKLTKITLGILVGLLLLVVFTPAKANAAYEAGRLIDDSVLLDAGSMSAGHIQTFLNNRGGQIANRSFPLNCDAAGQQAKQIYLSLGAPCNQTIPASHIIYYSAQVYGINPKVILATLQKEQSLITAINPTNRQYVQSMGYGCPTSGSCDDASNFFWQIDNGTWVLRYHYERARGNNTWWNNNSWAGSGCGGDTKYRKPSAYPKQNVRFYDEGGRHYTTVYIQNAATSAFYCYTPHVYNNFPGCIPAWDVSYVSSKPRVGSVGNCYSGSYNFVLFFEVWFGTTQGLVYNGVSYSDAFNPTYYTANNPDVFAAFGDDQMKLLTHFLFNGIYEGRQGSADFNVTSYKNRYADLRSAFGNNLQKYVWHYVTNGKREGRVATGDYRGGTTIHNGVNYSAVYDFDYYTRTHPDIWTAFGWNDKGALTHFLFNGIYEGRQGSADFNVTSYKNRYADLRSAFGNNLQKYVWHYVTNGKREGRLTTTYNGVDYSAVYSFTYYTRTYSDIQTVFGLNDKGALTHFLFNGIYEGRQGSADFNVTSYKNRYADLRAAFGNNLQKYVWHYVTNGKREGRSGSP